MTDEAWVRALQRRAMPLRVELAPWDELVADDVEQIVVSRAPEIRRRVPMVALAFAAGTIATLGWAALREGPEVVAPETAPLQVLAPAAPASVEAVPVHAPTPTPEQAPVVALAKPEPPEPPGAAKPPEPTRPPRPPRPPKPPKPPKPTRPPAPPAPPESVESEPPAASLEAPELLGSADVRAALDPVKDAVRTCGSVHGVAPGTKIAVKLTVEGATGTITRALVQPPAVGSAAFEMCVVNALQTARFARFTRPTMGVVFPFVL